MSDLPPGVPDALPEALDGPADIVDIGDWGTRGLGGQTHPDVAAGPDSGESLEPEDFTDFLYRVGRDESRGLEGGTYGFGRGAIYSASRSSTLIVYSRAVHRGLEESRFIISTLGSKYDHGSVNYTGRHWWGRVVDGRPEPVTGEDADAVAGSLGLSVRGPGELGTSLGILDPVTTSAVRGGEDSAVAIVETMREAVLWYFWPRMLDDDRGPDIRFGFSANGRELAVPDPSGHDTLRHFVAAYRRAREYAGSDAVVVGRERVVRVASERPRMTLGVLGQRRFLSVGRVNADDDVVAPVGRGSCRHVALLRKPRMVVKYMAVPADPTGAQMAGVFVADDSADPLFAASEPVAHDDWQPRRNRERYERDPVAIALRRIKEECRRGTTSPQPQPGDRPPSGRIGDALGGLLAGVASVAVGPTPDGTAGITAPRSRARTPGGGRTPRPRPEMGRPRLETREGTRVVVVPFMIPASTGSVDVEVDVATVVEGGRVEREAPAHAPIPELLWWEDGQSQRRRGPSLHVEESDPRGWRAVVSVPDDTEVAVDIRTERRVD